MPQRGRRAGEGEEAEEKEAGEAGETSGKAEKLSKMQERLLRRQARAKEWAEFNSKKPDDKYEDPVDVQAIQYAEANMGDFSLKTDNDYVVPEAQRVNAPKKRRQIVLLDESIHAIKMGFNERFFASETSRAADQLDGGGGCAVAGINKELGVAGEPLDPMLVAPLGLLPEEQPELRTETTPEELEVFAAEQAAAREKAKSGGGFGGGMGGGGGGGRFARQGARPRRRRLWERRRRRRSGWLARRRLRRVPSRWRRLSEAAMTEARLKVEKARLLERRKRTISSFDEALAELRSEKLKLEADLKTTDLRKLVLFQELALLKEFEKKDTTLAKRLESKHTEKSEIVSELPSARRS